MKCKNCGAKITTGNEGVCQNCGAKLPDNKSLNQVGFLPSFIIGLIASLFGIAGGFCMTMCSSFYTSGMEAFVLILGGSIVGLVGACKCLKNAKIGSILELIGAIMIIICAYGITGSDMQTVVAFVLFIISGVIGLIYSLVKTKK